MRLIPRGIAVCLPVLAVLLAVAMPAFAGMMTYTVSEPAIPQGHYPQPALPEQPAIGQQVEAPQDDYDGMRQRVVILHGIGRTSASMYKVARAVRQAGYDDMNIGYDSTRDVLAKSIGSVYRRIRHFSDSDREVTHFICYSLGCLVTRGIIEQHRPANLGRVVMLGPPNQGSEMADYLKNHSVTNWLFGPVLPQLGTANRSNLDKLIGTEADYELGIIAGQDSIDPVASAILVDPNDGRVPVERTKLPGMKEHLVMHANHTTLITNDAVIAQALAFLQTGHFSHDPQQ